MFLSGVPRLGYRSPSRQAIDQPYKPPQRRVRIGVWLALQHAGRNNKERRASKTLFQG
jgi:hypothetical protein